MKYLYKNAKNELITARLLVPEVMELTKLSTHETIILSQDEFTTEVLDGKYTLIKQVYD